MRAAPRLLSLDAFRGFTIAAMLLVNNPGSWSAMYAPLGHAEWHGWTFTDWVFPFFVLISGISMSFSLARRRQALDDRRALLLQFWRRGATLVALGLLLNLIPSFDWAHLRIPGVLQRLGLLAMLAAPLALYASWRAQLGWMLGLLVGYTVLQLCVPVPDAQGRWHWGSLQPGEDVGAWLDRQLLGGHLWAKSRNWDPEGLLSTLPALASQIAGLLTGRWLAQPRDPGEKSMWLVLAGLACLWVAELLHAWSMPINKSLWTPAYVFMSTGWGLLLFAVFHWLLDAVPLPLLRARCARLARPLVQMGMNALFLFVVSGLVAKLLGAARLADGRSWKQGLVDPIQSLGLDPRLASLLYALGFLLCFWLLARAMWRRGWFVKV
ncbi:hypothetical protein LZ017_04335 [Pelomonas sp. CA6]|uniref:acyltransferase family protein n=1 Tax=Pelomonas sp. CA6 TaxID=2907999 RepID=UPI001F4B0E1B|nr:heparan-alpha-glucosaminide N-acetyltransferase domain-containing protein [Pelomonas sp. CA6]MCH7342605.1 hypothetical protein [Pelomonas sp. CA6]